MILVANPMEVAFQTVALYNRTNADCRVLARGVSANHMLARTIFMAVAVNTFCKCVFA